LRPVGHEDAQQLECLWRQMNDVVPTEQLTALQIEDVGTEPHTHCHSPDRTVTYPCRTPATCGFRGRYRLPVYVTPRRTLMYRSARTRSLAPTRIITTIAVTAFLVIAGAGGLSARGDGTPKNKALVGSWVETVTFPPEAGRPALKSLSPFQDGGTMVCSGPGGVTG